MKEAGAAVAGDFEAGCEGGAGALQARRVGNIPAQGIALGNGIVFVIRRPERARQRIASRFISPFQGFRVIVFRRPRALPWAGMFGPFRAGGAGQCVLGFDQVGPAEDFLRVAGQRPVPRRGPQVGGRREPGTLERQRREHELAFVC